MKAESEEWPAVSVIMPVRNEAAHIRRSLGAVLAQEYPAQLQVIVADGMSTDGTREYIQSLQKERGRLILLDNPGKIAATGLNHALAVASGEVIVRVDGHTVIAPDYVAQCVRALRRSGADAVGGRMASSHSAKLGNAVALATGCPFGTGNARFHYSKAEEWVDTVYMGSWWRSLFDRIGIFNPEMECNEDDEFSYRILEHGGKVLLSPEITSVYTPRSTFRSLAHQYFRYGKWKVRVWRLHAKQMQTRQFVPPAFVSLLSLSGASAIASALMLWILALVAGSYVVAALLSAFRVSRRSSVMTALRVFSVFPVIHISYGTGFLAGLAEALVRLFRRGRKAGREAEEEPVIGTQDDKEDRALGLWPPVSVIMPVRNERQHIIDSLGAVLAQRYPGALEVIVADGMSDDGTRIILQELRKRHPHLILVENPAMTAARGLNAGLAVATGKIIVRVDGHTVIAPDYVAQCVRALARSGADCVGGRMTAWSPTNLGMAIALATGCPFGVGDARFHYSSKEEWVDTVYLGAWWRSLFDRIGHFNPELECNQDDEFSSRIRAHGGKILLSPSIRSVYRSRSTFRSLGSQYFRYGEWKVRVIAEHLRQVRPRQFAPPAFVITMSFLGGSAAYSDLMLLGLAVTAGLYATMGLGFAVSLGYRKGVTMVLRIFGAFPVMHVSYGVGFLKGMAGIIPWLWRRRGGGQASTGHAASNVDVRDISPRVARTSGR